MSVITSSINYYWYNNLEKLTELEPFIILDNSNILVLEKGGASSVITPLSPQTIEEQQEEGRIMYLQTNHSFLPLRI